MSKLAINGGVPVLAEGSHHIRPPRLSDAGLNRLQTLVQQGSLSQFRGGPEVRAFEESFAKYIGVRHALATTSGTTALHASIAALELSPGDEVLVPAVTFVSTASVALQERLHVVFVDIDEYFCMDPDDLERKITDRSRAILPVHLYGQPADMNRINKIAKRHNLAVIEDACQSHGARNGSVRTGALGDIGCFSFYETKNMTTGEGGMITTDNTKLYEQIKLRREHGSPASSNTWYAYQKLGYNYNMTEMQGLIGQEQLLKLDEMNKGRKKNAAAYHTVLKDLPVGLPLVRSGVDHVWHNFPVLLPPHLADKRDFFVGAMRAEGIPIDVAYPTPLYRTELFSEWADAAQCPRSEDITGRLFTLFTDELIGQKEINGTAQAIQKILKYLESQ